MTDLDYKKYSLENLENWINDAVSSSDATPREIYDVIVKVVKETYEYHRKQANRAEKLLNLLNGDSQIYELLNDNDEKRQSFTFSSCSSDDTSPKCRSSWDDFWGDDKIKFTYNTEDQVTKWRLPVEIDDVSGEYYFTLPDDLLEKTGWKEDDALYWVDNGDGSFTLTKQTKTLEMDEC